MPTMPKKNAPQIRATRLFRLASAVRGGLERAGGNTGSQANDGDDEDQHHEQPQAQRQCDIAAAAGLGVGLRVLNRLAHWKAPTAGRSRMCSASRVANSRVRYRIE